MYGHLKVDTADAVVAMMEPIQARYKALREDESALQAVMAKGAARASEKASKTLRAVYDAVGFISPN
jgi:tryptophanyl-tRNA synthetase